MTTCEKDFTLHIDPATSCYVNEFSTPITVTGSLAIYGSTAGTPNCGFTVGTLGRISKVNCDTGAYAGFSATASALVALPTGIVFCGANDCVYTGNTDIIVSVDSRVARWNGDSLIEQASISTLIIGLAIRSMIYVSLKDRIFGVGSLTGTIGSVLVSVSTLVDAATTHTVSAALNENARGICYRVDDDNLYVTMECTNPASNRVVVMDADTYAVSGVMPGVWTDYKMYGITHDPVNDKIYIAALKISTAQNYVLCVDPNTGTVDAQISVAATSVDGVLTYDAANEMVIVPGGNTVYGISTATNTIVCTWGPYAGTCNRAEAEGGKLLICPNGSAFQTLT